MVLGFSEITPSLIVLVIIAVVTVRRAYLAIKGATVSPAGLIGFSVLFTALFLLPVVEDFVLVPRIAVFATLLYSAIFAGSISGGSRYARRRAEFWRNEKGAWMYRLGAFIAVVYILLFALRLVLDLFVLGINPFGPPEPHLALSFATLLALVAVNALFALSAGLLVGRNIGVYLEYRNRIQTEVAPGDTAAA